MAEQTVIDELVVRMLGDDSMLLEAWERQEKASAKAGAVVELSIGEINKAFKEGTLSAVGALKELEREVKHYEDLQARSVKNGKGPSGYASHGIELARDIGRGIAPAAAEQLKAERALNEARSYGESLSRQKMTTEERQAERMRQLAPLMQGSVKDQELYNRAMREEEEQERRSGGGRLNMRSMRMLSHAGIAFANAKTSEQQAHALTSGVRAIGMAFGATGMIASTVLGAIIDHTNQTEKAANKAFASMIDGTKTLAQTLAQADLSALKKGFEEVIETVNPSTNFGKLKKLGAGLIGFSGDKFDKASGLAAMLKAREEAEKQQKIIKELMATETGREMIAEGTRAHADVDLANLHEKNELEKRSIGLIGKQVELMKIRLQLEKASGTPRQYNDLANAELEAQNNLVWKQMDAYQKQLETAGMTAAEKKDHELKRQGVGAFDREQLLKKGELADAATKAGNMVLSAEDKHRDFGLTASEAAARELERRGGSGSKLRAAERQQQTDVLKKSQEAYTLTLRGASDEEKAYAAALEGGTSQLDARRQRLYEQAKQLASKATGEEKKHKAFGLAPFEADARELERLAGLMTTKSEKDDALYAAERTRTQGRIGEMQGLTEELQKYALAMEGASAADKAAAMAKEGANKETVRQISYLQDAARTTEQFLLPQDKYMQQQERLDQLLKDKLITEQTYTRALGAEQAKLNKPPTPIQGVAFGSAEALSRQIAQRAALAPVQRLKLEGEGAANKELARAGTEKRNRLLEEIRDLLDPAKKGKPAAPQVNIGVGAGLGAAP